MKLSCLSTFFYLAILLITGCKEGTKQTDFLPLYRSGAEYVSEEGLLLDSLGNRWGADKNTNQITDHVFEGKYAIQLDSIERYGFVFPIFNPSVGELFQVSVWKFDDDNGGVLYCSVEGKNNRLIKSRECERKNGWVKLSLNVIIESGVEKINCFVSSGGKKVFFDEFQIKRHQKSSLEDFPKNQLNLFIPEDSGIQLNEFINHGVKNWMITKEAKKYVDAFIIEDGDSIPIQMRLKGDWADHLSYGKVSFRIKVLGNNSFNGLKSFSIQHPYTRNFLHEYFFHSLLDQEQFLTTTFDMIPVTINGDMRGVYALEEHFDKQLVESRQRREGPILKMDEQAMWASFVYSKQMKIPNKFSFYDASFISVFKKKRTIKSSNLLSQFVEGSKLLNLFKNHTSHPENVFEIREIAQLYALLELGGIEHGFAWHNRRFYYNPVTCKLEQIGFDLLPANPQHEHKSLFLISKLEQGANKPEECLDKYLLLNKEFRKEYQKSLIVYSDSLFLNKKFEALDSILNANEKLLAIEEENYSFDRDFYYNRAISMRSNIELLDSLWDKYMVVEASKDQFVTKNKGIPYQDSIFLKEVSINAYLDKSIEGEYLLTMTNYHLNEVEISGWYNKGSKKPNSFKEPIILAGFIDGIASTKQVVLTKKPSKIDFIASNCPDSVFSKKVFKWPKPDGETSRMELAKTFKRKSNFYTIKEDQLIFKKGSYNIDELLYIPSDYHVRILAGTNINFIEGGGLIVNNSFTAKGSKNSKIKFFSSDKNNHGITILQGSEVFMSYVSTENLDALHYKNWKLTGAVTIYETETSLFNCSIDSNLCEDALNIIRSNFTIQDLAVSNTLSDGFDADFCTGSISNSTFRNTGNDCVDFSGSEVTLSYIEILNSGDKGISGGERSILTVDHININKAIVGIAAKDDTKINGSDVQISQVEYSLAAFKKKPEYDVATIKLFKLESSFENLIDMGSIICVDGNCETGTTFLDIESMYSQFEKKK